MAGGGQQDFPLSPVLILVQMKFAAWGMEMKADDVVALYNVHAKKNGWQRLVKLTPKIREQLNKALVTFKTEEEWATIMRGWEAHRFFSGKSGEYKAKLVTMLYKCRYEEFYNDGLELEDGPALKGADAIVADWGAKLAALDPFAPIHIPTFPLPLEMPEDDAN